ncbi:hypothetical protein GCM10011414_14580 [Croceivirga lutea]|uniref:DsrE family protein n=1 Tax=Croceivirga lutea TaxID=1775167 RepID=UPI001639767A|nr:DsrE family protein [Croceivirga lutea]GGG46070.1 hypothetical protein GCM10011414_14580 [Croceivirga lutea]
MKSNVSLLVALISCLFIYAQEKSAGPILENYGKVWTIENPDFKTPLDTEYKVVFDIMNSPEDLTQRNASIETAARFLNMHAQSGVPIENMKVTLVVHNKASKDLCTNDAYKARYGVDNPNIEMIQDLLNVGVEFIFCGQSSLSRNFPMEDIQPGVQLGLSAMTALIQLQNQGYSLIKF